jgi:hypothetical protein
MNMQKNVALDILERVTWTALQAFLATWLVLQARGDGWDAAIVLEIAGGAAAVAAVKCILAVNIGDKSTAAALPGDNV